MTKAQQIIMVLLNFVIYCFKCVNVNDIAIFNININNPIIINNVSLKCLIKGDPKTIDISTTNSGIMVGL